MKKDFYENVREHALAHAHTQDTWRTRFILARTAVFPLMLVALVHGYDRGSVEELMLGGFFLLLFAVLVLRHRRLERRRVFTQAYLGVVGEYLARFDGSWKKSPVDGAAYLREKCPPDRDLHIFGATVSPLRSRRRRRISRGRGGGRQR